MTWDELTSKYKGRRVLVTGHTGFKGSWLCLILRKLGAEVTGYALPAPSSPSHFDLLDLDMNSILGDLRDRSKLNEVVKEAQPEVVFHMAAQPLVRRSYADPVETYEVNVMGTLHLYEACRQAGSVKALVNVTSDKCYENKEWVWGYRENEPMGGFDPYSSSKGCSELLTASYRRSFFHPDSYGKSHHCLMASLRAGNVIGGGDWAEDRLIPDIVRAVSQKEKVILRNPDAIRPWQHVLEPLRGYLMVASRLLEGDVGLAEGWNFGPDAGNEISVGELLAKASNYWQDLSFEVHKSDLHEASYLKLDSSKAKDRLGWRPVLNVDESIQMTMQWYSAYYSSGEVISEAQLTDYFKRAGDEPRL